MSHYPPEFGLYFVVVSVISTAIPVVLEKRRGSFTLAELFFGVLVVAFAFAFVVCNANILYLHRQNSDLMDVAVATLFFAMTSAFLTHTMLFAASRGSTKCNARRHAIVVESATKRL